MKEKGLEKEVLGNQVEKDRERVLNHFFDLALTSPNQVTTIQIVESAGP